MLKDEIGIVGKFILFFIFKLRLYIILPFFIKLVPNIRYVAFDKLLLIGYLNIATKLLKSTYMQSDDEKLIKERIDSMNFIRERGISFDKKSKNNIENISILFTLHNSFPYDKAGYAVRTDMIATHLQKKI